MAASLRHIQIVRLLYKSFFLGSLNTPLENLTRSIKFFFFRFQPLRTTTPIMETIRLTYVHFQKYVGHGCYQYLTRSSMSMQQFFFTFLKIYSRSPHR